MSRKNETLELYGETFTVVKPRIDRRSGIPKEPYCQCKTLYDAYVKPSARKQDIWEYWQEWKHEVLKDNNLITMYITGHNSSFFSIGGTICTQCDEWYAYYITPSYNYIWQI